MDESTRAQVDTVLIGGTGFIGTRLAAVLVERGKSVISIGLRDKPAHPSPVLRADVRDGEAFRRALPASATVFILTGQHHQDFNAEAELKSLEHIAAALNDRKPNKVFYLSSVLVYGETDVPAQEDTPLNPVEPYSRFKVRAEALLREKLDPSIALGIVRLSNVYGAPENRGFIHWLMQAAILNPASAELVLNGDGTQTRDYAFVDDVVLALVALEEKLAQSDTVNLATGKSYTLREVVDLASDVVSRPIPYTLNPAFSLAEVHASRISPKKLSARYGIALEHDLVSGLRLTADRYCSVALKNNL